MSKELEAGKNEMATLEMLLMAKEKGLSLEVHGDGMIGMIGTNGLDKIIKALTPPTEQEVCEALSEYSNKKVYYENGKFEVGKYEPSICYLQEDNIVWFNWFKLPPHIITMIGRFYEGKKNE